MGTGLLWQGARPLYESALLKTAGELTVRRDGDPAGPDDFAAAGTASQSGGPSDVHRLQVCGVGQIPEVSI